MFELPCGCGKWLKPIWDATSVWNLPLLSAFIFGTLSSIAPCQVSASVGAMGYLTKQAQEGKALWWEIIVFIIGKTIVYVFLGTAAIFFGMQLPDTYINFVQKLLGPLLIFAGLYMLGYIPIRISFGQNVSSALQKEVIGQGTAGSMLLGVAHSLAFGPIPALIFFTLLIPLGIGTPKIGMLVPVFYSFGTALPLLIFAIILMASLMQAQNIIAKVKNFNKYAKVVASVLFILLGSYDIYRVWLTPLFK